MIEQLDVMCASRRRRWYSCRPTWNMLGVSCRVLIQLERDGTPMIKPRRTSLARDRYAMWVSQSRLLWPRRTRRRATLRSLSSFHRADACVWLHAGDGFGAPQLHEEAADTALDWEYGDADAIEAMFASAFTSRACD